jgi:branched-chain amino acid transport system ATP-binding protein
MAEPVAAVEAGRGAPLLDVSGLTLRFGGVEALGGISIRVPEGSLYAVIGPNGAGKTSFFNCLTGYYRPSAGQVRLRGRDITRLSAPNVAALGVRRTFQNIRVFPRLTVRENVLAGAHLRASANLLSILVGGPGYRRRERELREDARARLEFVGLEAQADLPAGELPYGMRKRMEIARALTGNPVLMLLDEPAAGVSSVERVELARVIRAVRDSGITVVMIEHDVDLVMQLADEVCVLDHGRAIATGEPAQVREDPEVVRAYMGRKRGKA